MTDYWLSKLFFDLQNKTTAAAYRADRGKVLEQYPLKAEVRAAVLADDIAALAPLVNAYLLRYYFQVIGMPDATFIARLRATKPATAATVSHG
jgi:Aromatic-ring-opening dioxygenase LigAB, LigA subunit